MEKKIPRHTSYDGGFGFRVGSMTSDLDLNLDTGREFEFHEGVDSLRIGIVDVQKTDIGVEFELLAGLLVHESTIWNQDCQEKYQ